MIKVSPDGYVMVGPVGYILTECGCPQIYAYWIYDFNGSFHLNYSNPDLSDGDPGDDAVDWSQFLNEFPLNTYLHIKSDKEHDTGNKDLYHFEITTEDGTGSATTSSPSFLLAANYSDYASDNFSNNPNWFFSEFIHLDCNLPSKANIDVWTRDDAGNPDKKLENCSFSLNAKVPNQITLCHKMTWEGFSYEGEGTATLDDSYTPCRYYIGSAGGDDGVVYWEAYEFDDGVWVLDIFVEIDDGGGPITEHYEFGKIGGTTPAGGYRSGSIDWWNYEFTFDDNPSIVFISESPCP